MSNLSEQTARVYANCHRYLVKWYELRQGRPFAVPWSLALLIEFVNDHYVHPGDVDPSTPVAPSLPKDIDDALVACGAKGSHGRLSPGTLDQRLVYLTRCHTEGGFISPTEEPLGRRWLSAARRLTKAEPTQQGLPTAYLDQASVLAILSTCDDSAAGIRDRALLLFGWIKGGRRRGEIARADFERVTRIDVATFDYKLSGVDRSYATTDQSLRIDGAAGAALAAWIALIESRGGQTREGPVFLRVTRRGEIGRAGMKEDAVSRLIKRRAAEAGLVGQHSTRSLRTGRVTDVQLDSHTRLAGNQGLPSPRFTDGSAADAPDDHPAMLARSRQSDRRAPSGDRDPLL